MRIGILLCLLLSYVCCFVDAYANAANEKKDVESLLGRYRLCVGRFVSGDSDKILDYLSFRPEKQRTPVPLVVFLGGSGEMGGDIGVVFRQTTIFSVVTGKEFQSRHPCYLYVPHLPLGFSVHSGVPSLPNGDCRFLMDAIMHYAKDANKPKIDLNRIYITGLSKGGSIAFELPAYFPGVFAASVPVSTFMNERMVPERNACEYWLLCNKTSFASDLKKQALGRLASRLAESNGGLMVSTFPNVGHNAWDRAWAEKSVWDWMFTHSLGQVKKTGGSTLPVQVERCESNIVAGEENGMSPYNVVDGLYGTFFVSEGAVSSDAYWMCEFKNAQKGRWRIEANPGKEIGAACGLSVSISREGKNWRRVGVVRKRDMLCDFSSSTQFRFVKVQNDGTGSGRFFIRRLYRLGD